MPQRYKIYFTGDIVDGFDPVAVKENTQTTFKLNDENIDTLFNHSKHTLKDNLTAVECRQYLQQLLNLGLIGKSEPPLPSDAITIKTTSDIPAEPISSDIPKKSPTSAVVIFLLVVVASGGLYSWKEGYIDLSFLEADTEPTSIASSDLSIKEDITEDQPKVVTLAAESTNSIEKTPAVINDEPDLNSLINVAQNNIDECTHPNVVTLLQKILTQGIPQLVQQTSSDIQLTIQDYDNNQELYFDENRNKRLCSVIAKFTVSAPDLPANILDPSVIYEVIYEIQKDQKDNDQSIRLSTFRQTIVSSNLQPSNEVASEVE